MLRFHKFNKFSWLIFFSISLILFVFPGISSALPADSQNAPSNVQLQIVDKHGIWQDIDSRLIPQSVQKNTRLITPITYRLLKANIGVLEQHLNQAPAEFSQARSQQTQILSLPLPKGGFGRFLIYNSPMMEPALAAKYPEIRTYQAYGVDDPTASARLDITPSGFHGIIFSSSGTIYIDPYRQGNDIYYQSYYKRDYKDVHKEGFKERITMGLPQTRNQQVTQSVSGPILRTYRLAVAATGEYTQFHGGTVPAALAAITTTFNRVNGIFRREVSIQLTLIANTDQLIYTNPATDPYSNGFNDLNANQANIDNIIGNANYDIGHLVGTGGGGVVSGFVCQTNGKARGLTGLFRPIGDAYDVDFVSHEVGHQFTASHTWSGASCGASQFVANAAYELGSGSTIMGYAGTCSSDQNLQNRSDDYFHTINFDQITNFVTTGLGASCGTQTNTGNQAPIANAGPDRIILPNTPFTLTGSGTDADNDVLTYHWEQFDKGILRTGALPHTDIGSGPIFRSYPALSDSSRTFPNPDEPALASIGEALPTTNRTLTFRLTVRDGKGGVSYDTMNVTVSDAAATATATATASPTLTSTPTSTPTVTATSTTTPTATETATSTPTMTPTATETPTLTPTMTPTATETATSTPTMTPTTTVNPTATATPIATNTSTATPTATATASPTLTSTPTSTPAVTATSTVLPTVTETPIITSTTTATATAPPVLTPTATSTPTMTPSTIVTPTLTATVVPSATSTPVPTTTPSPTPDGYCCSVLVAFGGVCSEQGTFASSDDTITLYRRLRDETLMSSPVGRRFVNLYNEHTTELASILLVQPGLRNRTVQFLNNASDEFASLLPGSRSSVTLSQNLYDEADALIKDLAAASSSELSAKMLQVWAELRLDEYIGEQTTEIWKALQGSSIYLPIIIK